SQKKMLNKRQLHLHKQSVPFQSIRIKIKQLTELQSEDCLINCVKQPHLKDTLPFYQKINQSTPLIFIQNGMAHLKEIKEFSQPTYVGVIEHGASRINDFTVDHLGEGKIVIASV